MKVSVHDSTFPGSAAEFPQKGASRVPPPHPWIGIQNNQEDCDEKMKKEEEMDPEQRRGKWKSIKRAGTSMKKYLRRKMSVGGKSGKNDVIEVDIQPEDDTDYEKQWTRRMHRAQTFDSEGKSCSSQSSSAKSRDSETSRDLSRSRSPEEEGDGILVIHDVENDLDFEL